MNWRKWWDVLRASLADLGSAHCMYAGEERLSQTREGKESANMSARDTRQASRKD